MMKRCGGLVLAALSASLALAATPAAAAVELDQASVPETGPYTWQSYGVFLRDGTRAFEQTFTVGKAGRLTRIEMAIFDNPALSYDGDIILELFTSPVNFSLGFPTPLATQTIPMAGRPESYNISLSQLTVFDVSSFNIRVNVGDVLAVSARGAAGGSILSATTPYAGGTRYVSDFWSSPSSLLATDLDMAFRTYVDTAVPEPATWALMIGGFGIAGAALRRRKAQVA